MGSVLRDIAGWWRAKQFWAPIYSRISLRESEIWWGGRSGTYEKELQRARDIALEELQQRAHDLGANAVVGIDIDYEVLGKENGMLMVSASGTAVIVE